MLIEVQYFEGCPNSFKMIANLKAAIDEFNDQIEYKETLVDTLEEAERVKFRGSPTIIINGIDLENMPKSEQANLACRYYKNRLPTIIQIKEFIMDQLKKEEYS